MVNIVLGARRRMRSRLSERPPGNSEEGDGQLPAWLVIGRVVCGCVLLFAAAEAAASSKDGAYAVIAGTVFRENGFSLAGAAVTLSPKDTAKVKKMQSVSDSRGEFAFRVPAKQG